MTDTTYCNLTSVKAKLLISTEDTDKDDQLNTTILEASRLIDTYLNPYTEVPLNNSTIPEQIKYITENFVCGLFLQRQMPRDPYGDTWIIMAKEQIELYIKNTYFKGKIEII